MLYPPHVRRFVIIPALATLPPMMQSDAAVELLLGTALVESKLTYLKQGWKRTTDGLGVALGIFQIEPATYHDLWRYLARHPEWHGAIGPKRPTAALMSDLGYATLIARLNYWRKLGKLPAPDDLDGLAKYWKRFWNTSSGAGRPEDFIRAYRPWARKV